MPGKVDGGGRGGMTEAWTALEAVCLQAPTKLSTPGRQQSGTCTCMRASHPPTTQHQKLAHLRIFSRASTHSGRGMQRGQEVRVVHTRPQLCCQPAVQ
eukprot:511345-Pelagomonas_calceolata.AAC.1